MNQAIRKPSGLLVLPVLLAAILLMPVKAQAAEAAYECTARLPVGVTLNGESEEQFVITIAARDGAPMPEQEELLLAGDSTGAFEGFYYTEPGDYVYTVSQVAGSSEGMTYDDAVYTVTIQVTNAAGGGLEAQVYASSSDSPSEKVDAVTFLNTYVDPTPPADDTPEDKPSGSKGDSTPQTGDESPVMQLIVMMIVAAAAIVILVITQERKSRKEQP